uniref:uncharacterized protein LOC114675887 n=1 Tax=Macaca mulatta TaxID=9544 RepID=UPI0010A202C0|nr:uncharacterized protein LOC114675887 [Macaca mulatta]
MLSKYSLTMLLFILLSLSRDLQIENAVQRYFIKEEKKYEDRIANTERILVIIENTELLNGVEAELERVTKAGTEAGKVGEFPAWAQLELAPAPPPVAETADHLGPEASAASSHQPGAVQRSQIGDPGGVQLREGGPCSGQQQDTRIQGPTSRRGNPKPCLTPLACSAWPPEAGVCPGHEDAQQVPGSPPPPWPTTLPAITPGSRTAAQPGCL